MATTLANLRAKLNGELAVLADGDTSPWSTTVRNNAIADGYAALWRAGVWKDATEDFATVTDQRLYAVTSIRRLYRLEVLDSTTEERLERPHGVVEPDGSGGYQLRLETPVDSGFTLRLYGWTAYKATFSSDSDTDDLDAEYNRIPLLKAKAILWRQQLSTFVRFGQRQQAPPEMNVTVDQLLGMVAAAEREFAEESRALAVLRPRTGQARRV